MGRLIQLPFMKQEDVGEEVDIELFFPKTYEHSRTRFKEHFTELKEIWPDAELLSHPLSDHPEISIDWVQSSGRQTNEKKLVFTTGEHGVEGVVGSAMLEYFIQHYIPKLDPDTTGITLVHMIDPWGMKYQRRTNSNNVDLNRNFVWDIDQIDRNFNPGYDTVKAFLGPQRVIKRMRRERLAFFLKYLDFLIGIGKTGFWNAKILGQYAHPMGIHYGGMEVQEEVEVVKMIYRRAFETCSQLLQLDMHTGYGPRYQMTLVNSVLEPKSSADFKTQADYPRVAAMNPEEFYEVRGDMIDYVYILREKEFPEVALYATSFEFGTFGLSHWERFRSMRAMVQENQVYWYGARTKGIKKKVRKEFLESFSPSSEKWKRKAVKDADRAFRGILKMEGFI